MTLAGTGSVYAQSTTNGTIFGQVTAAPGVTVIIENVGTGAKRTITPDSSGRYQATALPPGTYKVTAMSGSTVARTEQIEVLAGQGTELNLAGANATQRIEIVGSGIRSIDVSRADGGATFTARELERLPVQPSVAAVVQLAPNTTRADFRYGNNAASFGGSGSSENAVFINGFTVTNGLFQVGYPSLPFGAIAQANIITGGYGAEFGRSTGGVINLTTKRGSNDFEFSAGFTYAPDKLRSKPKNIVYPVTGAAENAGTDGRIFYYNEDNKSTQASLNVSLGGPIIKDKLFFYAAGEITRTEQETTRLAASSTVAGTQGWLEQTQRVPRGILKLDWNITDNHLLEFTGIRDKTKGDDKYFGFNYATLQRNQTQAGGAAFENYAAGVPFLTATGAAMSANQGADINILKYTGYLTDNLTLQALIGTSKTERKQVPVGYIPGQRPIVAANANRAPGLNYTPSQPQGFSAALLRDDAMDKNTGSRFDLEYKLGAQHTLRGGVDANHIKAANGTASAGGGTWTYQRAANPAVRPPGSPAGVAAVNSTVNPLGATGYYVDEGITAVGSTPQVRQAAQYIEDRFQVTNDLLLVLGLRNEQFKNTNQDDKVLIEKNRQLAPRFSAAWDVMGDASFKVFGTAGRYHLQIPANLAVRFAGGSLNTTRSFTYAGVDPVTGAPTGLIPLGNTYSINNEFGQAPDPSTIASKDIRSNTQDEFTLGFEKALTREWKGGVRLNYRNLKSLIDDVSDSRPLANKLRAAGFAAEASYVENTWHGALFNPGRSNTFVVPVDAAGRTREITVAWSDWGFPDDPKRKYYALDFMLEHALRNGWYGKLTYTLSKSTGNTEGQQKSDNGQADVGFTSTWDYPELMVGATGELPNSRRHQIKALGVYQFTDEYSISSVAVVASGRPKSATCNLSGPDPVGVGQYGSIFYTCPDAPGRGALGRMPWEARLDLGFMYRPSWLPGLSAKVDVFNVTNRQTPTAINEARNTTGGLIVATSQQVINYTPPRAVMFSAQYTKKF